MNFRKKTIVLFQVGMTILFLSGCLSSGGEDSGKKDSPNDPTPDGTNSAPTISGNPASAVTIGQNYSFTPTATDSDGDTLTFSVQNLPNWASFDTQTGTLTGSPQAGSEGTYADITISVSDDLATSTLDPFSIVVSQAALGSLTVSWLPPSENEDGSAITDLAGFKIYHGTQSGTYSNSIRIDNPGITSYVVENLSPNTYFLVATAFNSQGVESFYSNEAVGVVSN